MINRRCKVRNVTVKAVVSSIVPGQGGFYLMEEKADRDNDDKTSEGLFVADGRVSVAVGDLVVVEGKVEEKDGLTTLVKSRKRAEICASSQPIDAVSLDLPVKDLGRWESLEGMKVQFTKPLTISDSYQFARRGQLTLSGERLFQPTNQFVPGPKAKALDKANRLNQIVVNADVQGKNRHPQLAVDNPYRLGNLVEGLSGVVTYNGFAFTVEPDASLNIITTNDRMPTPLLKQNGGLRIASFNVLNYFNGDGSDKTFPTRRGAKSKAEFKRQNAKIIDAMVTIGADVYGLMELENDGYGADSAIVELTNNLSVATGRNYRFVHPGRDDLGSGSIAVGIMYDADVG